MRAVSATRFWMSAALYFVARLGARRGKAMFSATVRCGYRA